MRKRLALCVLVLATVACAAGQPKSQQTEPCAAGLRWDEAKWGECPKDGK